MSNYLIYVLLLADERSLRPWCFFLIFFFLATSLFVSRFPTKRAMFTILCQNRYSPKACIMFLKLSRKKERCNIFTCDFGECEVEERGGWYTYSKIQKLRNGWWLLCNFKTSFFTAFRPLLLRQKKTFSSREYAVDLASSWNILFKISILCTRPFAFSIPTASFYINIRIEFAPFSPLRLQRTNFQSSWH